MLPLEIKQDSDGLLYIDNGISLSSKINFQSHKNGQARYQFLEIPSTSDYIIKYQNFPVIYSDEVELKRLLKELLKIQEKIRDIDFPLGYYVEDGRIKGQIIRNYHDVPSLNVFSKDEDLESIAKYYYQDDDMCHNLILLYLNILDLIEEMIAYSIYYLDIHGGNFVLFNNEVKLIDFEPKQIFFTNDFNMINRILMQCKFLINTINYNLWFKTIGINNDSSFLCMREEVMKMEKRIKWSLKEKNY